MSTILPGTLHFVTPVYGTVFGSRAVVIQRLKVGDQLILVPDAPGVEHACVWVHAPGGDVIGHLSPDLNRWMVSDMLSGARYGASVQQVAEQDTESWRRLMISVRRV